MKSMSRGMEFQLTLTNQPQRREEGNLEILGSSVLFQISFSCVIVKEKCGFLSNIVLSSKLFELPLMFFHLAGVRIGFRKELLVLCLLQKRHHVYCNKLITIILGRTNTAATFEM
jgi:hypothetical protein